ncbi:hypothetical protein HPP92_023140 [Vanilla planifolia]|uniref:Uncharacterized protein n=1 Tax=Vanilla planifolia TaxID=51239 RepID=A0A835PVH3_VANPL|nr:hypothetical protein HPP92_023140 [Vanilla planifolia]
MPSGSRKRKSAKRKNASTSPPQQGWLRSHLQMLKAPSFRSGTRDLPDKEDEGRGDTNKGKERILPQYIGTKTGALTEIWDRKEVQGSHLYLRTGSEDATAEDMDKPTNGGTHIEAMPTEVFPSMSEELQKVETSRRSVVDESTEGLHVSVGLKKVTSGKVQVQTTTVDGKFENGGDLKGKGGEDKDTKEDQLDRVLEISEPVANGVAKTVSQMAEVAAALNFHASPNESEKKVTGHADDSMEAPCVILDGDSSRKFPLYDDMDASTPKTEIPHLPVVVSRGSIWNCCGLLEVFVSPKH